MQHATVIVKSPLCFIFRYVQPATQQYKSRTIHNYCNQSSHYEKYGQSPLHKGNHHILTPNRDFLLSVKMDGAQRRTLVSPWRMHCTYYDMLKGTFWTEATLNSEKIGLQHIFVSFGIHSLRVYPDTKFTI